MSDGTIKLITQHIITHLHVKLIKDGVESIYETNFGYSVKLSVDPLISKALLKSLPNKIIFQKTHINYTRNNLLFFEGDFQDFKNKKSFYKFLTNNILRSNLSWIKFNEMNYFKYFFELKNVKKEIHTYKIDRIYEDMIFRSPSVSKFPEENLCYIDTGTQRHYTIKDDHFLIKLIYQMNKIYEQYLIIRKNNKTGV